MTEKFDMKIYDGPMAKDLKEWYGVFSQRLIVGKNKLVLFPTYMEWHEKYQEFKTKPSDVWVISYPKAGTTWTQEIAWCVLNDFNSEKSKEVLMKRFPFFEWDSLLPDEPTSTELSEDDPCAPGVTWKTLNSTEGPRRIKSHLIFETLPKDILASKAKIVYVCRDPKDVCVSYYFHSLKLDGFTGTFDNFFDIFVQDLAFWSPFWRHVLDFWEKRDEENIMFIRYEELKEDLPSMIRKLSQFLGRELTDDYIERCCDHLSFSSMSQNKAVNNESIFTPDKVKGEDIKFMRKGKVGDWRSHFSEEQIETFRKWTNDQLKDSDFPYYRDF